ncbi:MAG TPA: hypothetical protein VLB50_05150 [Ignavibacteriaceae bacterium]|nr:hypothetical protein [Ignavibacteriaceae bacterium]
MKLKENPEMDEMIPLKFYLSQNYPNPFKETTTIKYCVGYKTRVLLTIHNSEREKVDTLIDDIKEPGTYKIKIDLSATNYQLTEGTFYYRFTAGNYTNEKRMKVIR